MAGVGRPKGSPKAAGSGRKIGSVDKRHTATAVVVKTIKFDPLEELIKMHDSLTLLDDRLSGANAYYEGSESLIARKESICKTLLPYIHSRKAQEVVQHNINTDMPDVTQARSAIMKAMMRLQSSNDT